MFNKIGFGISVLIFIMGAIGTLNSYTTTFFDAPGDGSFSMETLYFLMYPLGAFSTCYFLEKVLNKGGFWVTLGLPLVLLVGVFLSFVFTYDSIESSDLKKNGVFITSVIDSTEFKWIKTSRHNHLYYNFSYHIHLPDSVYQFTQWWKVSDYGLMMDANPIVTYDMVIDKNLRHPRDSIRVLVSTVHPWRHRIMKRR